MGAAYWNLLPLASSISASQVQLTLLLGNPDKARLEVKVPWAVAEKLPLASRPLLSNSCHWAFLVFERLITSSKTSMCSVSVGAKSRVSMAKSGVVESLKP